MWCVKTNVIVNPRKWGGPSQLGAVAPWGERVEITLCHQAWCRSLFFGMSPPGPDSIPAQSMQDLTWTKWRRDRFSSEYVGLRGPGSIVGIATDYGLDGPGSNPGGGEIFRTCPDRPWSPPSLLYKGYRVFPGCKERPGRDADPSPPSSAVVMKE